MAAIENDVGLALLAVLEAKARKKGRKSIVPEVLRRLRDGGASEQVLGQVAALNGKKPSAGPKVKAKKKLDAKATTRAKSGAKTLTPETAALHA
jgi:hypothetical protein